MVIRCLELAVALEFACLDPGGLRFRQSAVDRDADAAAAQVYCQVQNLAREKNSEARLERPCRAVCYPCQATRRGDCEKWLAPSRPGRMFVPPKVADEVAREVNCNTKIATRANSAFSSTVDRTN